MTDAIDVRLLAKPGCHLCDDARKVVVAVADAAREQGIPVSVTERNILEDAELQWKYGEEIPVVFVADRRVAFWHVDPGQLRAAIDRAAGL